MERIEVSKHFTLDEFVDIRSYLKDDDNGLSKVSPVIIDLTELLRVKYGKPIYVNTWWKLYIKLKEDGKTDDEIIEIVENSTKGTPGSKVSKWSGYRPPHCPIGASKSIHKKGGASDNKGAKPSVFLKIIEENAKEFYDMGLRRIEGIEHTPTWLHMDTGMAHHKPGFIRVVGPKKFIRNIDARG